MVLKNEIAVEIVDTIQILKWIESHPTVIVVDDVLNEVKCGYGH